MWVSGSGRADVIVRAAWPIDHLEMEVESPINTVVTFGAGAGSVTRTLVPRQVLMFDLKTSGVRGYGGDYACLLTVRSTAGFIPHMEDPQSTDYRNLSVQVRFRPVIASSETPSPK
jgi:predicted ATP-grasp superfamily ATP-dependent carboligase